MASNILISTFVLFSSLFSVELHTVAQVTTPQNIDESCVLSFVVPKEKMKSSCDVEEKFRRRVSSVEMKINVYKHRVSELQTMLSKERELNAEKIENLKRLVREGSLNADSNTIFDRRLAHLEQEFGRLNSEIVQGRTAHAQNRNAIEDHLDYNFNALDQNPVTLPNLVKSMVQAEIENVMGDYTKRFENYVQEQMIVYSKVYNMMAEPKSKPDLQGRLKGRPTTTHEKFPEIYKETVSKSIMNQLSEFQHNIDKTGEEIAKNVNTYLQDSSESVVKTRRSHQKLGHEHREHEKYQTVSEKDRTNMITSTSTTSATTTSTTTKSGNADESGHTENNTDNNNNTSVADYEEEYQLTNSSSELVITEETTMEVNESFSGENPDSKEKATTPITLTRKTETEIVGSASSRISGGIVAPAKNNETNTYTNTMSSSSTSSIKEKYEENTDWRDNMVMDQNYDKEEEEEKLIEKVRMLLVHPMAEMMSLVEKQNNQVNSQIKSLQDEVTHNLPKTFATRMKTSDQGIERNSLQIESVSQAVQDLYVKVEKIKILESAINQLKENATSAQSNNVPVSILNEHEKRISKLERLTRVYSQSLDHYKNETKQEYKQMQEMLMRETMKVKRISKTLQKNITGAVEKMMEGYNESQSAQVEDLKTRISKYDENILLEKLDVDSLRRKIHSRNKDVREVRENVEQLSNHHWDLKRKTDSMYRKFPALEAKLANTSSIIEDLKTEVKLSMTDAWLQIDFDFDGSRSECFGDQYVRRSNFKNVGFVGVVLCTHTRYKILLGKTLESKFLNIGDGDGMGEDHCEFVGGSRQNRIVLSPWKPVFGSDRGYARNEWGQEPRHSMINAVKPTPKWYECGVTIP